MKEEIILVERLMREFDAKRISASDFERSREFNRLCDFTLIKLQNMIKMIDVENNKTK